MKHKLVVSRKAPAVASPAGSYDGLSRPQLLELCRHRGIQRVSNKKVDELRLLLRDWDDASKLPAAITPVTDQRYRWIYHLADLHIRPLERHDEYREVFERLYAYLRAEKSSHASERGLIILVGDILEDKTRLTPECITLTRSLFRELATIMDIVLVAGNHDGLHEVNQDRVDNLSALVEDLPIHYLRYTGVYRFGDWLITVNSLVDHKFIKAPEIHASGRKICLFHGTLDGARNDLGYLIQDSGSSRYRGIRDFEGFDLVCLGDIHRHQFLQPHIAYCSSLIQQNQGESLDGHGLIRWDLRPDGQEGLAAAFVPVHNDYGYATIPVEGENAIWPVRLPAKSRLVFRPDRELTDSQRQTIFDQAALRTQVLEHDFDKVSGQITQGELTEEQTRHMDDRQMLQSMLEERLVSPEQTARLLNLHDRLKAAAKASPDAPDMSNHVWELLRLEFRGVLNYGSGKTNVIDFERSPGVISVVGPNTVGKSSLINLLLFALFDDVSSSYKRQYIMSFDAKECFVKVEFRFAGVHHIIEKTGTRTKRAGKDEIKYHVLFYRVDGDQKVCLNADQRKNTYQGVAQLLGKRDDFLLSNVFSNSAAAQVSLLNMSDTERLKQLQRLFRVDNYDYFYKQAHELLTAIELEAKHRRADLDSKHSVPASVAQLEADLARLAQEFDEGSRQRQERHEQLTLAKHDLEATQEEILSLNGHRQVLPPRDQRGDASLENELRRLEAKLQGRQEPSKSLQDLEARFFATKKTMRGAPEAPPLRLDTFTETVQKLRSELQSIVSQAEPDSQRLALAELELKQFAEEERRLKSEWSRLPPGPVEQLDRPEDVATRLEDLKASLRSVHEPVGTLRTVPGDAAALQQELQAIQAQTDQLLEHTVNMENIASHLRDLESLRRPDGDDQHYLLPNAVHERVLSHARSGDTSKDLQRLQQRRQATDKLLAEHLLALQHNEEVRSRQLQRALDEQHNREVTEQMLALQRGLLRRHLDRAALEQEQRRTLVQDLRNAFRRQRLAEELADAEQRLADQSHDAEVRQRLRDLEEQLQEARDHRRLGELRLAAEQLRQWREVAEQNRLIDQLLVSLNQKREQQIAQVARAERTERELEQAIQRNEIQRASLHARLGDLLTQAAAMKGQQEELAALESELQDLRLYKSLMDKRGIPFRLLSLKVDAVNAYINRFLEGLVQYRAYIKLEEGSVDLAIEKNGHEMAVQQISGYETFIANLAIKRALTRYSFNSKGSVIAIDEGLDVIDKENFQKLPQVLKLLRQDYRHVILITHIDEIKQKADHQLRITKVGLHSEIC